MGDASASLTKPDVSWASISDDALEQNIEHYREDILKRALLNVCKQMKDDTIALREESLKTALHAMQSWHDSSDDIGSPTNINRLNLASESSRKAFNLVTDTVDKIRALSLLIYADYHLVALTSPLEDGTPDWVKGKQDAQQQLERYVENNMPSLISAAKEELSCKSLHWDLLRKQAGLNKNKRSNKDKRRKMLREYAGLTTAVFCLHPISENTTHPMFPELEGAVLQVARRTDMMLAMERGPIVTSPCELCSLKGYTQNIECLEGHTEGVFCCSVLEEGKKLVSGSADGTLKVWDLTTGEETLTLEGHTGSVYCCSVSEKGKKLVSGSNENDLKVWDLVTEEEICTLKGHTGSVYCCSVFEQGEKLVSGSDDGTLRVWDLTTEKRICTLKGHKGTVYCCSVFDQGKKLVSGSDDDTLKVWDLTTGEAIRTLKGHTDGVLCCSVFEDGKKLVSGSCDSKLKLWDLTTGKEICTLANHGSWVKCCNVFAQDTRLVSGSRSLKVWALPHVK